MTERIKLEVANIDAYSRIEDYPNKLTQMSDRLPAIIGGEVFQREISRFLPQEVLQRTLQKPTFSQHLIAEVSGLLQEVQVAFGVRSGTRSRT